jgi:general secretion pathway protein G
MQMNAKLSSRRRGGFSLIEVLVVVVIITILAAVVAVNVMDTPDQAKVAATRATLQNVKTMLAKYALDQGAVPTQQQGLQALMEASSLAPTPQRFPPGGYLSKTPTCNIFPPAARASRLNLSASARTAHWVVQGLMLT